MIDALDQAAYIMNRAWDVLAHKKAASILFEDFKSPRPNILRIVFFSDNYRQKVQNWHAAARLVLLKARHDYMTGGNNPILGSILNEVLQAVPPSAEWWDDPEVVRIGDTDIALCDKRATSKAIASSSSCPRTNPGYVSLSTTRISH
jgi:hypothetical protein